MPWVNCDTCGKNFFKTAYHLHGHNFCCHKCQARWIIHLINKAPRKHKRVAHILVTCDTCGEEFSKLPRHICKYNFCCKACQIKWFAKLPEKRKNQITRNCQWCGREFATYQYRVESGEGKFCSCKCQSRWHSSLMQNSEYRQRNVEVALRANRIRPNKAEIKLQSILNEYFPDEWEYTGDGYHIIGGFSPDFTNRNGHKALIELFGDYWHSPELRNEWHRSELGRIMAYNSLGHRCLIIWEHELKDEKVVVDKVKQFMKHK